METYAGFTLVGGAHYPKPMSTLSFQTLDHITALKSPFYLFLVRKVFTLKSFWNDDIDECEDHMGDHVVLFLHRGPPLS